MNRAISSVLRYGLAIAMFLIGAGFVFWILLGADGLVLENLQKGTASFFPEFFAHLSPENIIALGLGALILLPFIRVTLAAVLFLIEKDFLYFGISMLVVAILVAGVLIP